MREDGVKRNASGRGANSLLDFLGSGAFGFLFLGLQFLVPEVITADGQGGSGECRKEIDEFGDDPSPFPGVDLQDGTHGTFRLGQQGEDPFTIPSERPRRPGKSHQEQEKDAADTDGLVPVEGKSPQTFPGGDRKAFAQRFELFGNPDDDAADQDKGSSHGGDADNGAPYREAGLAFRGVEEPAVQLFYAFEERFRMVPSERGYPSSGLCRGDDVIFEKPEGSR